MRTQQIIAHETGVSDSVDPMAGAYVIEMLTDRIEKIANEYIAQIDDMGGALEAINTGFMQREIQEAAYRVQREIESGEDVVVGLNDFQIEEEIGFLEWFAGRLFSSAGTVTEDHLPFSFAQRKHSVCRMMDHRCARDGPSFVRQ